MALPVSGQSLAGAYIYEVVAGVTVGVLANVTAADLLTPANAGAGTTISFGTNAGTGSQTVTYTLQNGSQVTQNISTAADLQSTSAFTFTSGGNTYIVSNGPLHESNSADVTVGNLTALIGGISDTGLVAGADDYVACYAAGTRITTPSGERAVEALAIGDSVTTASGLARSIRWIGTRSYGGRFLKGKQHLLPILFRVGSLGENLPRRDLRVSSRHAMFLDGVLVPAEELVNGSSIVRDNAASSVSYFHIELDRHDLIIAEGAISESFVDDNSRCMFLNAADYDRLYPDAPRPMAIYCAPRVTDGYRLEAIRRRLSGGQPINRAA